MAKLLYAFQCPFCKDTLTLELEESKVNRWKSGELIQDVFPELDDDTKERMISGICPKCWDKMFKEK